MQTQANARARQANDGDKRPGPCPHLGLPDDPGTSFAYPAPANHCYWAQPPAAVQLDHQRTYCLTQRHRACPIFQKEEKVSPAHPGPWLEQRPPRLARVDWRQALNIVAPAVALVLIVGLILLLRPSPAAPATGGAGGGIDQWQQPGVNEGGSLPLVLGDGGTATDEPLTATAEPPTPTAEVPSPTPTSAVRPTEAPATATPCSRPAGWTTYIVSRGQTLSQIALSYGVSVSELQAANCLESEKIDAGQAIYVPYRAPQPQPATTEAPAEPPPTATAQSGESEPAPPPDTTEPPPTATSALPTATSPPPTATPPVPGEGG